MAGEQMHRIVKTKKGRYVLMVQNPKKIGKFGEWKILANKPSRSEAESVAVKMKLA
jgi:Ni,Fe-hydrogenase I small subunit